MAIIDYFELALIVFVAWRVSRLERQARAGR